MRAQSPPPRKATVGAFVTLSYTYSFLDLDWPVERAFLQYGGWPADHDSTYNDLWLFDLSNVNITPCPWVQLSSSAIPGGGRAGAAMAVRDGFDEVYLSGGYAVAGDTTATPSDDIYVLDLLDPEAGFTLADTMQEQDVRVKLSAATEVDCTDTRAPPCWEFVDFEDTATEDYCSQEEMPDDDRCDGEFVVPGTHDTTASDYAAGDTIAWWMGCVSDPACTGEEVLTMSVDGRARHGMVYDPGTDTFVILGGTWGCEGPSCTDSLYQYGDAGRGTSLHLANIEGVETWSPTTGGTSTSPSWKGLAPSTEPSQPPSTWPSTASYGLEGVATARLGVEWTPAGFEETSSGFSAYTLGGCGFQEVSPKQQHVLVSDGWFEYHGDCGDFPDTWNDDDWSSYHPYYSSNDPWAGATYGSSNNYDKLPLAHWTGSAIEVRSVTGAPTSLRFAATTMRGPYQILLAGGEDSAGAVRADVYEADLRDAAGEWFVYEDMATAREGFVFEFDPVNRIAYATGGSTTDQQVEQILFDDSIVPNETSEWSMGTPTYNVELVAEDELTLGADFGVLHVCEGEDCYGNLVPLVVATLRDVDDATMVVYATVDGEEVDGMIVSAVPADDDISSALQVYFPGTQVVDGEEIEIHVSWTEVPADTFDWKANPDSQSTRIQSASGARTVIVRGPTAAVGPDATGSSIAALYPTGAAAWTAKAPSNYLVAGPGAWTRPTTSADPWEFEVSATGAGYTAMGAVVLFVEDGVELGDLTVDGDVIRVFRSADVSAAQQTAISAFLSGTTSPSLADVYTELGGMLGTNPQGGRHLGFVSSPVNPDDIVGVTWTGIHLVVVQTYSGAPAARVLWLPTVAHELAHGWLGWRGIFDGDGGVWFNEALPELASWRAAASLTMGAPPRAMKHCVNRMWSGPVGYDFESPADYAADLMGYEAGPLLLTDLIYLAGGNDLDVFWTELRSWAAALPGGRVATLEDFTSFVEDAAWLNLPDAYSQWKSRAGMPLVRIESISLDRGASTLTIGVGQGQHNLVAAWTEAYTQLPYILACSAAGADSIAASTQCSPIGAPSDPATLTSAHATAVGTVDLTALGDHARVNVELYSMPWLHPAGLVPRPSGKNLSGAYSRIAWCEDTLASGCATDADGDGVPSGFVAEHYDCEDDAGGATWTPFTSGATESITHADKNCDGWTLPLLYPL